MAHPFLRLVCLGLGLLAALPVAAPLPVAAQTAPIAPDARPDARAAAVMDVLRVGEIIGVMRQEGLEYGTSLEAELFPGRGGSGWAATVARIYDPLVMERRFEETLARELGQEPAAVAGTLDFFGDERGQRILTLEIEARRALLDEATEEAAQAHAEDMAARDDPRLALLRRFAEANDLVEANVQGALNANLAFYRGMAEGGDSGSEMTEEQMLSDVWAQEPEIRTETEDWLYPYLALAYGPLADDDLQAYIDFSVTDEGRRLNRALFAAFDAVFEPISRDLGRAAARQLLGQDI